MELLWPDSGRKIASNNLRQALYTARQVFKPDLPQEQIEKLSNLTRSNRFVLVSPYPDLPAAVVASAWGKQPSLQSAENPDLKRFVRFYSQGPQVRVEPGHSSCRGGEGSEIQQPHRSR